MRNISTLLLIAILALTPLSCVHNNGDIGDWFGTWRLESIKINGQPDTGYDHYIIWKFQSDMVVMVEADDILHERDERFGTWRQTGDLLELNFSYSTDGEETQASTYIPPAATHIPPGISVLDIVKLSKREIQLIYVSPDNNNEYFYTLKKWG